MKAQLKKLDAQITKKAPQAAAALRPPADAEALARLQARFGGAAPADLLAWFAWHDGEQPGPGVGFDPDSNFFAIPLDEGLRLSREVLDPSHGHPILSNGGGAWVCHREGTLVRVQGAECNDWAPSLEAWVVGVTAALTRLKVPRIFSPAENYTFEAIAHPTLMVGARAMATDAAPGTVYVVQTPQFAMPGQPSPGVSCALMVKMKANEWLAPLAGHGAEINSALLPVYNQWRSFVLKAPGKSSGYLKTDEQAAIGLIPSNGTVLWQGTAVR